ncbi:MAG: PEP-CTERM sorting domain-containing protein [Bryobacteraceae bacterium]
MLKLACGALCLALSTAAHAGAIVDLTLDSNFASPDYAFYSYTSTTGQAEDNIPVDPYITYLNGDGYNDLLVYSFCFDFNSPTDVGTTYPGSFEVATDTATMEATYLINQLYYVGLINAPLATRGAIATAIWEIMNPSSDTSLAQFPSDPAAQPYEVEAAQAVANGSWSVADSALYPMWVPQDPTIQRFGIVFTDAPPVPEPASFFLVGLGFVGLGVVGRKRRVRAGKSADNHGTTTGA